MRSKNQLTLDPITSIAGQKGATKHQPLARRSSTER
jgi:hypothetical protein